MCYDCLRPARVTILHFSNGIIHITLSFIYCSHIQSSLRPRKHGVLDLFKLPHIDYWISSGFQQKCPGFLKAARDSLCFEVSGPNFLNPEMTLAAVLK